MTKFCGPDASGRIEWPDIHPRCECWVKVNFAMPHNRGIQHHQRHSDGHFVMWFFSDRSNEGIYAFRVESGWYMDYLTDGTPDGDTMFGSKYPILSLWGPFSTMQEAYDFKVDTPSPNTLLT